MKKKKKGEKRYVRSDGWVFSKEGMENLRKGGMKGHLLSEASITKQIGHRNRVTRSLDRDAVELVKAVKGVVARALFVSNAIIAEAERA